MANNNIGVFDSGIGGVTVLKEIIKLLPNYNYIYYRYLLYYLIFENNSEEIS